MDTYFTSTLFNKMLAALSGLFLVLFLIGHLAGNLQLIFLSEDIAQKQFNEYAKFMTTNPGVKILSLLTYGSILLHTILTLSLAFQSKRARPVSYAASHGSNNATWISRNMPLLGIFILIFLVVHLRSFWYEMHWGTIGDDPWGNRDLFTVTVTAFKELWYVIFYVFSFILLSFHLQHGIASGFQSLGLKTKKYIKTIEKLAIALAILIPMAFASIPIIIYLEVH
tara:strand:- start:12422 stop:13096 length:675 start_codon:yes stop_codon:yes gene_type:complete